ncbi:hypothetical protein ABEF95_013826 [Exophiala dermatitidis]
MPAREKFVKQGLVAEHTHSPMITVVIRKDKPRSYYGAYYSASIITEAAETENASNVFYINRDFLIENSRYFAIVLDTANTSVTNPPRTIVYPPQTDVEMFTLWLDSVLRGEADKTVFSIDNPDHLYKCFEFADSLGSYQFRNQVMDAIQPYGPDKIDLKYYVSLLEKYGKTKSMHLFKEYALECLGYRITSRGWADVVPKDAAAGAAGAAGGANDAVSIAFVGAGADGWTGPGPAPIVPTSIHPSLLSVIFAKIEEITRKEKENRLDDLRGRSYFPPDERKDCTWHEHTDKDRVKCPGYWAEKHKIGPRS